MKNKQITAVFEYDLPDIKELNKNGIIPEYWYYEDSDDNYELRFDLHDLNEKQKNILLSYCSGSTIKYIQENKPDYVIFYK